ncbi:streptogrisin C [Allocatelliglobosispora scoriae]|uniref:Streptogrisin C n=1 Tax=Allocatelliglobosispora scoriae TaxID=643052 RepID=A0A841BGN8_9ACTN|nr:fibronectin type III domain-containing protein [Allocatelliglobosispora scoriae]MBB5868247.1 streptogrisin C [Allocatelliglobosispora scoriae]
MRMSSPRHVAVTAAIVLGVAGALTGAPAHALRPVPDAVSTPLLTAVQRDLGLSAPAAKARLAQEVRAQQVLDRLRVDPAQTWFDAATGTLAIAVTDDAGADRARAAGAQPVRVNRGLGALTAIAEQVRTLRAPSGVTGWGPDARSDTVVISVNRHDAATDAFLARARAISPAVTVVDGAQTPVQHGGDVRGGDSWKPGTESQCTIGFPVTSNNGANRHFLSAGHCTNDVNQAAYGKDGTRIGTSNVGGNRSINALEGDFGLIDVTESAWTLTPVVTAWGSQADVRLTGSKDAVVGTAVCHSGATSHWRCGSVTKVNQTVNYGSFSVGGLTYASACGQGGDSGGSWVSPSDSKAVGLHEGGYGDSCGQQEAWFQPVNEALAKWSLTLVTDAPPTGDTQAPTVPANLRSTGTTASSVSLAWDASTDNVGVTAYDIYQGSSVVASGASTSATVSGLAASTSYTFTVKARDAAGNTSAASGAVTATTQPGGGGDTQAPTVPGNLRSTGTTASSVSLAWNASTDNVGVTAYDIYQGSSVVASGASTSATVSGLAASTSYTFTVKARDAAGNVSAASGAVTATTLPGGGGRVFSTSAVVFIPDPGTVDSPLTSTATGSAASTVSLTVSASHWCGQEVGLVLVAPNGSTYPVKASGGSGCTNYTGGTYTVTGVSSPAAGVWKLRATDVRSWNFGSLSGWSITL